MWSFTSGIGAIARASMSAVYQGLQGLGEFRPGSTRNRTSAISCDDPRLLRAYADPSAA